MNSCAGYSHYSYFMLLGHCNILTVLMIYILLSHFWYNRIIISFYFNCKGEASTSVLPFYTIAALPDDGCNYLPKHVIVNEINKWILNHLWCCIDLENNKQIWINSLKVRIKQQINCNATFLIRGWTKNSGSEEEIKNERMTQV